MIIEFGLGLWKLAQQAGFFAADPRQEFYEDPLIQGLAGAVVVIWLAGWLARLANRRGPR
mgnify:FL=1